MATAYTDYQGKFVQGYIADLVIKIININGMPTDPINIFCVIKGPLDDISVIEEVKEGVPFQVSTGFYALEWKIPPDQVAGKYQAKWSYVLNGDDVEVIQNFVVSEDTDDPFYYGERMRAFSAALEHHINAAQSIPIYSEQAKQSGDNQKFYFSFPRWNPTTSGIRIYRNDKIVNMENININYDEGSVNFNNSLLEQENVKADYNFRWFGDMDLFRFIINGIQSVNAFPPHSAYGVDTLPNRHVPAALYGAAKDALRQLMMSIQFQEPAQIFGGSERADKVFSNLESLKQNYEKDWEKLLEQKKFGPYPSFHIVSIPEYALPGGRSRWFRYLFK